MKKSFFISLLLIAIICMTSMTGISHADPANDANSGADAKADAADTQTGDTSEPGANDEYVEIVTLEDLDKISEAPGGKYRLMTDLDLSEHTLPAVDFTGVFDGNGHVLINLGGPTIGTTTYVTYDGNRKTYDTVFGGLFSSLDHAEVRNLKLLGVNLYTEIEGDCFLGGIAGYANESTIENCEITGTIRLDVNGKMFGVGGVIGYGNGVVRNCKVDVTLINIDTDAEHRDEQYLGAICSAGYPDIDNCIVNLAGFISDHGFVHSGGLVGMYIVYPKRFKRDGFVKDNDLKGFITFFEDNTNRRAYCVKDFGEVMDHEYKTSGNSFDFVRDERKDYKTDLLPHGDCKTPGFEDSVVAPECGAPGYTVHTCKTCGYTYKDGYKLAEHQLSDNYQTLSEPSVTSTGLGDFTCKTCGAKIRMVLPSLTPTPTPAPTDTPTPTPSPTVSAEKTGKSDSNCSGSNKTLIAAIVIGVVAVAVFGIAFIKHTNDQKRRRARRKKNRSGNRPQTK